MPRRSVLLWIHILCAAAAAMALVSQETLEARILLPAHRATGFIIVVATLPALWPYFLSFLGSRGVVPQRAGYLTIYVAVLIVGTCGGVWFVSQAHPDLNTVGGAFLVSVAQALAFGIVLLIIRSHADRHGAAY